MKIEKKLNDNIVESVTLKLSNQIDLIFTPNYDNKSVEILMKDKISNLLDLSESIDSEDIGMIIRILREVWICLGIDKNKTL